MQSLLNSGLICNSHNYEKYRLSPARPVQSRASGFTLVELIVVIAIFSVIMTVIGIRVGAVAYYKEEGFIRRLSETIVFLHHQAVADQAFYHLEFDLDQNSFAVGIMRVDSEIDESLKDIASDVGVLSLELAAFLNPALGEEQTLIPPPSYPSLAEPIFLPQDCFIEDIQTMRGKKMRSEGGKVYISFSPRGFSEFAVIHLRMSRGTPITILVNPFTGLTELFREYKEFEWSYGRKNKKA